jgi:hypothetical protein
LPPPMQLEDARGGCLSITVRRGLYHALNLPMPDVAFAPNAGLAVEGYASHSSGRTTANRASTRACVSRLGVPSWRRAAA